MSVQGKPGPISRKAFLGIGGMSAAALLLGTTPFHAVGARAAMGQAPSAAEGYGPLVPKGDIALPAEFNYQVVSRQGVPMGDGQPTPGIFDAMGAFRPYGDGQGTGDRTVIIRNHENRRRPGEIPVRTPVPYDPDPTYFGGCTKLVVERNKAGRDRETGQQLYEYTVVESFAIQSGTDTNCAGGVTPWGTWLTCEEVVNRSAAGVPHGYIFEIDAFADGPVEAVPIIPAGRFVHEAAAWRSGILYETEDRSTTRDSRGVLSDGSCFYRYSPGRNVGRSGNLAETTGPLEALKLKNEFRADMDRGRVVGQPYEVEWVLVDDPNPQDDTDQSPQAVRKQAQRKGAAVFDREEGLWVGPGDSKVYFDCTSGGNQNLGQIWEYDPGRETVTLIFEAETNSQLENPDNITVVPQTQDIFVCEDSNGEQFVRGLTLDGEIYDFARTISNNTEFCGAVFDPDAQTLYLNQQGERGGFEDGPPGRNAVTYAIYGPFEKRAGANNKNFGNGQGV